MIDATSPTTPVAQPTGTIDITNLVTDIKSAFISWATAYVYGLEIAIPGMEWIALPVLSTIDQEVVKAIITVLVNSVVMEAFFINTAIRKASQAQDFQDAVSAKNSLPPTTSQDDYAKAEAAQMLAFRNFVMLGN